jgi:hypothetical protein
MIRPSPDRFPLRMEGPTQCRGFAYFDFLGVVLIISSNLKNTAISSSSGGSLEGGLRKGITSDIGLPPGASPRCMAFSPAIVAFLRRALANPNCPEPRRRYHGACVLRCSPTPHRLGDGPWVNHHVRPGRPRSYPDARSSFRPGLEALLPAAPTYYNSQRNRSALARKTPGRNGETGGERRGRLSGRRSSLFDLDYFGKAVMG